MTRDAFCPSCGTPFADTSRYPRVCTSCGAQLWNNPTPVAVVLVPVVVPMTGEARTGLLVIRRAIPPIGELALVGGFVDADETWQQAAAREVWEEAGLKIDASTLEPLWFTSTEPDPRRVLLFSVAPPVAAGDLPPFTPNSEVSERGVIFGPDGLAFPLHEHAARMYLRVDGPVAFTPL